MDQKIMYYDNIVSGAGIAHTLACFNYALKISRKFNYELIVPPTRCGHGLGKNGEFEKYFGITVDNNRPTNFIELAGDVNLEDNLKSINDNVYITRTSFNNLDEDYTTTVDHFINHFYNNGLFIMDVGYNIGIHIRRGDVVNNDKILTKRVLADQWYVAMMYYISKNIRRDYGPINLHIFTQTLNGEYVNEYKEVVDLYSLFLPFADKIYLHYDGCPYHSLKQLSTMDLIIGGKSGFSSLAGLFSDSWKILFNSCPGRALPGTTKYQYVTDTTTEKDIVYILKQFNLFREV